MIEIDKAIQLINAHWRFDKYQQPNSSWHEKRDLLKLLRDMKTKQEPVIGSNGIADPGPGKVIPTDGKVEATND